MIGPSYLLDFDPADLAALADDLFTLDTLQNEHSDIVIAFRREGDTVAVVEHADLVIRSLARLLQQTQPKPPSLPRDTQQPTFYTGQPWRCLLCRVGKVATV